MCSICYFLRVAHMFPHRTLSLARWEAWLAWDGIRTCNLAEGLDWPRLSPGGESCHVRPWQLVERAHSASNYPKRRLAQEDCRVYTTLHYTYHCLGLSLPRSPEHGAPLASLSWSFVMTLPKPHPPHSARLQHFIYGRRPSGRSVSLTRTNEEAL